ncbi:4'-phosphopantetheinyl transferase superfamily protein [Streptomyces sp. B8F3]|uniref:4'-phosphopantetheinyl transferase superfamily protein n=1 Tax=unclassified Streptomyces TaxID=2593676 RepID=UPI00325F2877
MGAEIEQVRAIRAFNSMVGSCLTPAERSYVTGGAGEPERRSRFYRCRARKEAVLQAVGTGLAGGLARLEVWPAERGGAVVAPDAPGPARYRVLRPALGDLLRHR